MKKKILSIDGGGMRGIVSAVLLQSLEEKLCEYSQNPKARIGDYFDLVAGTSTGSILTVLYLYPNERGESKYSAKEVIQAYIDYGSYIFRRQWTYPFWGAKYTNKYFEEMLKSYFGDSTLGDLRKPCLLTSYDITKRSAVFFNSVSGRINDHRNYMLRDAILSSTAAPTYFPPTCQKGQYSCYGCLIDGGVVANNPSMCALIEALKLPECERTADIITVSVGNVKNTKSYSYKRAKLWGLLNWAIPMFDILMDGSEQTVDYQLRRVYKSIGEPQNYIRMQLKTESNIPKMDAYSQEAIDTFLGFGYRLAEKEKSTIDSLAKMLVNQSTGLQRAIK
ncbi:MAG: patatin-like phospholipase family protein [Lachnospiraceae bacterium]|nr:patatin-like phospholipase family protein [Clostridiales bacterium]MDD6036070.1 patatin-like phospholipase family protein [Lachnospiraceae bacterium]